MTMNASNSIWLDINILQSITQQQFERLTNFMEKNLTHFTDIKFTVKVKDIHKIERKKFITGSVFGYENKKKSHNLCVKKCYEEKHVDLLIIEEGGKKQ